ncbi:MAG: hypothetical protein FJX95_03195 [Bacteroidetes bacterium]|nr:hypothetical protein [Bacteroidota bacterium]
MMTPQEGILHLLSEKSTLKQDVYHLTIEVFKELKTKLESSIERIKHDFGSKDSRVEFYYKNKGDLQAEIKVAGDILVFQMHTNVFQFEPTHPLWKSGYFLNDPKNSYVGVINIYNFLSDSFKYNREQDLGYLIGRIFINKDRHFCVQGKRQLGFLFQDMINGVLDDHALQAIVDSTILYTLNFDMYIPPYEAIQQLTVFDMQTLNHGISGATGKRLGFQFGIEADPTSL